MLVKMLLVHLSSVKNSPFLAQNIAFKKPMKFAQFIAYLLLKSHKTYKYQQISSIF